MSNSTRKPAAGTNVIVIGAGLAGLSAAVHAVKAGAYVRLIADGWGQQMVTPGWISVWDHAADDVLTTVRAYATQHPQHPYALLGTDSVSRSIPAFRTITEEIGVPHDLRRADGHNLRLPTLLGAIQTPLLAPRGLANGDLTGIDGTVLLVGFNGWRDFYPELAAGNLGAQGIDARAVRIELPDTGSTWDAWPGDLARLFDRPDVRAT
ncbi:MAG: FAD-binding protein, partial [Anaerolineae bacterium]|nr:FAD-binding protein [Anaerolineae bacterium]